MDDLEKDDSDRSQSTCLSFLFLFFLAFAAPCPSERCFIWAWEGWAWGWWLTRRTLHVALCQSCGIFFLFSVFVVVDCPWFYLIGWGECWDSSRMRAMLQVLLCRVMWHVGWGWRTSKKRCGVVVLGSW